jgi:hypothetical protein
MVLIRISNLRASETFYLLGTTGDVKESIKISDAALFLIQVELKLPLHLLHAKVLGMERRAH